MSESNKKFKRSYVLSCLGSLQKRKSSLQGKLKAMFSREKIGEWGNLIKAGVSGKGEKEVKNLGGENRLPDSDEDSDEEMVEKGVEAPATVKEEKLAPPEKTDKSTVTTGNDGSQGRVTKRRRYRKRKRRTGGSEKYLVAREVFANARINSGGDLSARVGKKY